MGTWGHEKNFIGLDGGNKNDEYGSWGREKNAKPIMRLVGNTKAKYPDRNSQADKRRRGEGGVELPWPRRNHNTDHVGC